MQVDFWEISVLCVFLTLMGYAMGRLSNKSVLIKRTEPYRIPYRKSKKIQIDPSPEIAMPADRRGFG